MSESKATEQKDVTTSRILSMDEFLAQDDIEFALVPGFKRGEFLRIKSLTANDVIEWRETNAAEDPETKRTRGLRLIVKSLVDKDGNPVANETHLPGLRKKSTKITEAIIRAILDHNGLNTKQETAAKND